LICRFHEHAIHSPTGRDSTQNPSTSDMAMFQELSDLVAPTSPESGTGLK
jgi:hypothetical protein